MTRYSAAAVASQIDRLAAPAQTAGPLEGVRVLDLSRVMAGNMLSSQLADAGAEVIKIESPGTGDPLRHWLADGVPVWWRTYSRNKKSVTLDLRKAAAQVLLKKLVGTADIFVENYRPATLEKMGLAPELLLELQPKLVIARISGWGQTGPFRNKPGFGSLVEAYSGLAAKTGFEDRPPVLPNMTLADMITGLHGFGAVLAALHAASRPGGRGQSIDLSLFDSMLSCIGPDAATYALTGETVQRSGSRSMTAAPRNVYRTADGHWVALSATTQAMTERLFRAIGRPDLVDDDRTRTNAARLAHIDLVDDAIQAFIGARSREQVLHHFEATEVTVGPVMAPDELLDDDFVRERQSLVAVPDADMGRMPMHNVVPRFSRTPGGIRSPAPALGEHNRQVLAEFGVTEEDLAALAAQGVV